MPPIYRHMSFPPFSQQSADNFEILAPLSLPTYTHTSPSPAHTSTSQVSPPQQFLMPNLPHYPEQSVTDVNRFDYPEGPHSPPSAHWQYLLHLPSRPTAYDTNPTSQVSPASLHTSRSDFQGQPQRGDLYGERGQPASLE